MALIALIFTLAAPCAFAEGPDIRSSQHVFIGDMDTGAVFFEKNADEAAAPASITKMMVLLLGVEALERGEVAADEIITASSHCWDNLLDICSNVGISAGEKMPYTDLLYCIALASACDGCNVLAERVAGSIPDFITMMNERAEELGCTGTHFADTTGLSFKSSHYTTAHDLFRIAREGMHHELFAKLVGTAKLTIPATNIHGARELNNSNALINADAMYGSNFVYDGACGIKTGRTTEAGYCLVSAAERNDMRFICVVLHASKTNGQLDNFVDSTAILDWAFENCERRSLVKAGDKLGSETLELSGGSANVELLAAGDLDATLLIGSELKTEIRLYDGLSSVSTGNEIGDCVFLDQEGIELASVKIKAGAVEFTPTATPEPTSTPEPESTGLWNGMSESGKGMIIASVCAVSLLAVIVISIIENKRRGDGE